MGAMDAAFGGGEEVEAFGAAPGGEAQGQAQVGDGVDVVDFAASHDGDADFDFGHARVGKCGGDLLFLCAREGDAGRLFAVAQGGVDEMNLIHVQAKRVAGGSSVFSSRQSRMASAVSMVTCLYQRFSG